MNSKISNFKQVASVCRYTITSGREAGLDVIDCNNGKIRFLLNVSRALDVMQLYYKGENVSFLSKNAFNKEGIDFDGKFPGGMVYTCGLESYGVREGFAVHGTVHSIPAEVVTAKCDEDGVYVEANIHSTVLGGRNITLNRKITCKTDSDEINVYDTLINNGYVQEDYCLLYHVNIGYPFLDEGCKIDYDETECIPATDFAKKVTDLKKITTKDVPVEEESLYFLKLKKPEVVVTNPEKNRKITITYSDKSLPKLVEWKNMVSGEYVLGIEPATSYQNEYFEYKQIKAKEKIEFNLSIGIKDIK